jgi:hypothetical protein
MRYYEDMPNLSEKERTTNGQYIQEGNQEYENNIYTSLSRYYIEKKNKNLILL